MIHAEATPILYGKNTFFLGSLIDTKQCKTLIGNENFQSITHEATSFPELFTRPDRLREIASLTRLKSVELIGTSMYIPDDSIDEIRSLPINLRKTKILEAMHNRARPFGGFGDVSRNRPYFAPTFPRCEKIFSGRSIFITLLGWTSTCGAEVYHLKNVVSKLHRFASNSANSPQTEHFTLEELTPFCNRTSKIQTDNF